MFELQSLLCKVAAWASRHGKLGWRACDERVLNRFPTGPTQTDMGVDLEAHVDGFALAILFSVSVVSKGSWATDDR